MTAPLIYRQDLFGDPVRLETDSGRPRCRHAVPWPSAGMLRPAGFDQCKRAGQHHVQHGPDKIWLCNAHNPAAVIARRQAQASKAAAASRRERLAMAAPRLAAALAHIRDGCEDPAGRARQALEGLDL